MNMCAIIFITKIYVIVTKQIVYSPGHSRLYELLGTYIITLFKILMIDGKLWCILFCYLSKTLDNVWRDGVLYKLLTYGVSSNVLAYTRKCMVIYVIDHEIFMHINLLSSNLNIYAGVPQGSVLGAVLFMIYVNAAVDNV